MQQMLDDSGGGDDESSVHEVASEVTDPRCWDGDRGRMGEGGRMEEFGIWVGARWVDLGAAWD